MQGLSIDEGVKLAMAAIDSGAAEQKLQQLVALSQTFVDA